VRLGGQSFEIVGVAPRSFDGIERMPRRTGAWIPLRAVPAFGPASAATLESRTQRRATVIGRLAPNRTRVSASTELSAGAKRLDMEVPLRTPGVDGRPPAAMPRSWTARGLTDVSDSDSRLAMLIVALVGLVLVVACTNLANLMIARGAARQRDIAVRRALGAGRWRLVRELLVESLILAFLGGAVSLPVIGVLLRMATIDLPTPGRMFSLEPELNMPALAVAAAALVVSVLVFGLEPALQLTRRHVLADLSGGDHAVGVVPARRQRAFIRWQVATSVTFFLIAAVLARVLIAEAKHDAGVDLDRLAVATVFLQRQSWDESRARATLAAIAEQLRHEPGIEQVALSSGMPFGLNTTTWATATTTDRPFTPSGRFEMTDMLASSPEIFRTLGVAIVRGRGFDHRDDSARPRVMVVSEKTARTFFGTSDVVGRQLLTRAWGRDPVETYTIVGVARDTDSGRLMSRGNDTVYVPLAQHYEPFFVISARTSGDPPSASRLIQKVAQRVAPDLALGTAGPASVILGGPYFAARVGAVLATTLGGLTLVLAMVGLYGVQSHLVARRTRELGVRLAIGATRAHVERLVLGEGFRPVFEGFALGCAFAVLARVTLRAFVYGNIQAFDLAAFALVPVPLIAAAFVACYLPARRASRVDPNVALRHL
jgi:predicted permease